MAIAIFDLQTVLTTLGADLGLTSDALAEALEVDSRTIRRWMAGESLPQHAGRTRIDALVRLRDRLQETFTTADTIHAWMQADNRYLGGLRPADAVRAGRVDVVNNALEALDSGIFV